MVPKPTKVVTHYSLILVYLVLHTPWQLGYLTPSKNRRKNPHFTLQPWTFVPEGEDS